MSNSADNMKLNLTMLQYYNINFLIQNMESRYFLRRIWIILKAETKEVQRKKNTIDILKQSFENINYAHEDKKQDVRDILKFIQILVKGENNQIKVKY